MYTVYTVIPAPYPAACTCRYPTNLHVPPSYLTRPRDSRRTCTSGGIQSCMYVVRFYDHVYTHIHLHSTYSSAASAELERITGLPAFSRPPCSLRSPPCPSSPLSPLSPPSSGATSSQTVSRKRHGTATQGPAGLAWVCWEQPAESTD